MNTIGERIARLRNDLGLTQDMAAARSPISQATWSRIESGNKTPHLGEVLGISTALGCFVSTILDRGETLDQLLTAARTTAVAPDGASSVVEDLGFYLEMKSQLRAAGFVE